MITINNKDLELTLEQEKIIRLEIAVMLYEKADYSFYVAAKYADMHWMEFIQELDKREISIFSEESLGSDFTSAVKHAKDNN